MDFANLQLSLGNILPEISVAVFLMIIVGYDLISHENKKAIPYIALVGLIITGIFVLLDMGLIDSAFAVTSLIQVEWLQ